MIPGVTAGVRRAAQRPGCGARRTGGISRAAGRGGAAPQGAWVLTACTVRIGLGGGPLIQTFGASDLAAP